MTPEDALAALELGIRAADLDVRRDEVLGRTAVVAHWTQFKWRWFATKLHLFLVASPFSSADATTEELDRFLSSAREYGVRHKQGLPAGFQTGVAVIAVAVVDGLAGEAVDWASRRHGGKFAAIAYPVSFDVRTTMTTRPERMVFGAVYAPYLRRFVDEVVAPALAGPTP